MSNNDFEIENGVLKMYNGAGCNVVVPVGVTSIGESVFRGCENLQSITLPESVTSIGEWAFRGCTNLQNITIPESVTSIGDRAFWGCENLQNITIPESVTFIGARAFQYCTNLQSVTFSEGVISIGDNAFEYCANLQNITIPESVTSIGNLAFNGCKSLQSITIPESVTSIGEWAFSNCENLQSITIPESVTSIGDCAFSRCKNLQSITLPKSVTSIGDSAFQWCENLQSITIPESVTSIGDSAFQWCENLQSITLPKSVTSIEKGAFQNCSNLTDITLPDSIKTIDTNWFCGCKKLKNIKQSDKLISLGKEQIEYEIENGVLIKYHGTGKVAVIPESVTSIKSWAFCGCKKLKSVIIPAGVTSIENGELENENLTTIVGDIELFTDSSCKELVAHTYLTSPERFLSADYIENIKSYIFSRKKYLLEEVFKEDTVKALYFFADEGKLTKNNIEEIFLNPALKADATQCVAFLLDWKNKNVSPEYEEKQLERELTKEIKPKTPGNKPKKKKLWTYTTLSGGTLRITGYSGNEKDIVIPEYIGKRKVSRIGNYAFSPDNFHKTWEQKQFLQSITSVTISGSVSISDGAFQDCKNLQSISLPGGVTEIGWSVFRGCTNLQSITLPEGINTNYIGLPKGCKIIRIPNK